MKLLTAPPQPLQLPAPRQLRICSFGGGVQSTAVFVLQMLHRLPFPYDIVAFSNVGHDSENPLTLAYVDNVIKPLAREHGIRFVELQKTRRDGSVITLYDRIMADDRSIPIPARLPSGAPGNRACTSEFKIKVVDKLAKAEAKRRGVHKVIVGLGISTDEAHRARFNVEETLLTRYPLVKTLEYPLIDLRISRAQCLEIIKEAGLPAPPKSSCYFCPFHSTNEWRRLKREQPDLFQKAAGLDDFLRTKRGKLGRDAVYLHQSLQPLSQAVANEQLVFDFEELDVCESGYCMV